MGQLRVRPVNGARVLEETFWQSSVALGVLLIARAPSALKDSGVSVPTRYLRADPSMTVGRPADPSVPARVQ